ncbi:MAG: hypothetical protein MSS66_06590 [Selenomonadaceae bacterium]|nr:hypothetical protein [Selenomonadaceae bacterium]
MDNVAFLCFSGSWEVQAFFVNSLWYNKWKEIAENSFEAYHYVFSELAEICG